MNARRIPLSLAVGALLVGVLALIALVSLVWLPYPIEDTSGGRLEGFSPEHLLGTDRLGHDVASALLDVLIAFPTLLLAMLIVAGFGASLVTVTVAIGVAASAVVARLTRILARRVLAEQYVLAARTSGVSTWGILTRHVLPNIWPTLATNLAVTMGGAVLAEAGLSYLGLGAPPPNASWGRLLQDAQATFTMQPLGAIAPGIAIVAFVLGTNLAADGLRSLIDPTQGGAR